MTPEVSDYAREVADLLSRFHVALMHGKFAAAKVSTFVVSDFCVVWDFDCKRLCITPQVSLIVHFRLENHHKIVSMLDDQY